MRDSLWNKRIPTLLGLTIITIGIAITSFLVQTGVITIGRATPAENPVDVRLSNITDTSFTVSYTTQAAVLGSISYGTTTEFGRVGFDDRDQKTQTSSPYSTHYITIKNLQPDTIYFFAIVSGKDTYLNNGIPFQIKTAPRISGEPPTQEPASGKVVLPNGTIPAETLVYLMGPGTQTLSALTRTDGLFIIPLNSLRTEQLSAYATLQKDQRLELLVTDGKQKSEATVLSTQLNPIPPITLSQNYNFTMSTVPVASPSAQTSFPAFSATVSNTTPQILTPRNEQEFSDTQPQFRGTAQPGEEVQIEIHSEQEIKTTVVANSTGSWVYRPPEDLAPGDHTITIKTRDTSGIMKTIMRPFTVYAAGNQVAQSATPSATMTPKPTTKPTAPVVPTATIAIQTPTPTVMQTTPTPLPLTPTPVLVVAATKGGEPEAPGSTSTMILGFAAIITTTFGVMLLLFTRRHA